jgi:hypothetical protein
MRNIVEPNISPFSGVTNSFITKDLQGNIVEKKPSSTWLSQEILKNITSVNMGIPSVITNIQYVFTQDYKENKKGDVINIKSCRGCENKFEEEIQKKILITKNEKDYIDKYPTKIKSLVSKDKQPQIVKDSVGNITFTELTPSNMNIVVKPNKEYRGVLLDNGSFKVVDFSGANIILEKGEYELLDKSVSSDSTPKDNKNLINIALLLGVGYVVYRLVKK